MAFKLLAVAAVLACTAAEAAGPQPPSAFDRGNSLQTAQDPRLAGIAASCKTPPALRKPRGPTGTAADTTPPPAPELPATRPIPGVLAFGRTWKVVWAWEGNNADGPIAADDGALLFANNDASNVMRLDPDTGLATVLYDKTNTGGALSRSRNGALFVGSRGIGGGIEQLEPKRRRFVNTFNGEPLECAGGSVNDLMADARGGVYLAISGSGVFYANRDGVLTQYGDVKQVNGIILSPDEKTLYVTNGPVLVAFDVGADGALANQREFGKLRGGRAGDGSAVDSEGRIYVSTGSSVDVFSPDGGFLGSIPAPKGTHGVVLGGKDGKTLFGIVFYGGWGTPSARNQIVAIPLLSTRYMGRAK
jgi:xylono-1,5-lactonase